MSYIVEAKSLSKKYGSFTALDGVDLSIPSGAISGLIGPNGAGKTTTLKALTSPRSGDVDRRSTVSTR